MEDTNKENVKEEKASEMKKVEKTKLGPAATVMLTIAATLGIIVLVIVLYLILLAF